MKAKIDPATQRHFEECVHSKNQKLAENQSLLNECINRGLLNEDEVRLRAIPTNVLLQNLLDNSAIYSTEIDESEEIPIYDEGEIQIFADVKENKTIIAELKRRNCFVRCFIDLGGLHTELLIEGVDGSVECDQE